jgi:hypothetical protein
MLNRKQAFITAMIAGIEYNAIKLNRPYNFCSVILKQIIGIKTGGLFIMRDLLRRQSRFGHSGKAMGKLKE